MIQPTAETANTPSQAGAHAGPTALSNRTTLARLIDHMHAARPTDPTILEAMNTFASRDQWLMQHRADSGAVTTLLAYRRGEEALAQVAAGRALRNQPSRRLTLLMTAVMAAGLAAEGLDDVLLNPTSPKSEAKTGRLTGTMRQTRGFVAAATGTRRGYWLNLERLPTLSTPQSPRCMALVHLWGDWTDCYMTDSRIALTYLAHADALEGAARHHRRQAVRDARAAGALVTEIAATLGIRNRNGLYAILDEVAGGEMKPEPTPAIFLRGAGMAPSIWAKVTTAMQMRGWMVVRDRTQAWHLARARVPVVMINISHHRPTVGRVRARYSDAKEQDLPLVGGHTIVDSIDGDELALAVLEHLQDLENQSERMPADFPLPTPTKPIVRASILPVEPPGAAPDLKKRSIMLPDAVWEKLKALADGAHEVNLQQLIAAALNVTMTKIEQQFNAGQPFPPVERLTTGPRSFHEPRTARKAHQITLSEPTWSRARAIVGAGHAPSLPDLLTRALREQLA